MSNLTEASSHNSLVFWRPFMMELDHLVPDGVDVDVPGVVNTTSNPDISLSNEDIGDYMKVLTGNVPYVKRPFVGKLNLLNSLVYLVDFESYDDEKNLEDLSTQVVNHANIVVRKL